MLENRRKFYDFDSDLALITEAAHHAGEIALEYFYHSNKVWMKENNSPVSEADMRVDAYLKSVLTQARPDYGWLSEESTDNDKRLQSKRVFVVDPIDGTRGFIGGQSQWCISIAVIEEHAPIAAVLNCPVLKDIYCARLGGGTRCNGLEIWTRTGDQITSVAGPRKWLQALAKHAPHAYEIIPFVPSLAYRIAMVADGQIDAVFTKSGAHDWDLAAADLIVSEAGGILCTQEGERLEYNCPQLSHDALFAVRNNQIDPILALVQQA